MCQKLRRHLRLEYVASVDHARLLLGTLAKTAGLCCRPCLLLCWLLEDRQVAVELVIGDVGAVALPFDVLRSEQALEDVVAETAAQEIATFSVEDGLVKAAG